MRISQLHELINEFDLDTENLDEYILQAKNDKNNVSNSGILDEVD